MGRNQSECHCAFRNYFTTGLSPKVTIIHHKIIVILIETIGCQFSHFNLRRVTIEILTYSPLF